MRSVCVFCGGNPGARTSYLVAARELGEALAEQRIALVYGGASVGLMGAVADGALARGGVVRGVLPEFMMSREIAHRGLTELELVSTMHERKAKMGQKADAFVALPGGYGTMDELFEVLSWSQLGLHRKPVALLNVDGYFDGLIAFIDHATREGLVRPEDRAMLFVEGTPKALLDRLATYALPDVPRAMDPAQA